MEYSLIQKYSEEHYYTKCELENDFSDSTLTIMWEEIEHYRTFFKHNIKIGYHHYYVTYNPYVSKKIFDLHQQYYKFQYYNKEVTKWLPCSNKEQQEIEQFKVLFNHCKSREINLFFENTLHSLQIELDNELINFLVNKNEDIFLKVFLCILSLEKPITVITLNLICSELCHINILSLIDIDKLYSIIISPKGHNDLTYCFLAFLDDLYLKLCDKMLLYDFKILKGIESLNEEELHNIYPMLKKKQIEFFLIHHQVNHYYTIRDYMSATNVSYETARYSLEELVKIKWYQKLKVGKKFVYHIL
ncbi:MAG: hypothetical protein RR741_06275 [Erysipelotrichaceae bacterium]